MKKLFTILCLLVSGFARGQVWPGWNMHNVITFDSGSAPQSLIVIDSSFHRNNWQIGKPQKMQFDSALSLYNALVTDTVNPCAANDTSRFTLKLPQGVPHYLSGHYGGFWRLLFKYKLDLGAHDTARIELSIDGGLLWMNVKDPLPTGFSFNGGAPNLSPGDTTWRMFDMLFLAGVSIADTLLFRFTLTTDTSAIPRDGWMIDNIDLQYLWEGSVSQLPNPNLITLYPNPSHGNIYVHTDKPHKDATMTIHNIQGQQVYSGTAPANGYLNLQLPNGIYTLRYSDEKEYCVKQIVIQH